MYLITQVLLALSVVTGSMCQTITLGNPRVITPCDTGARADLDRFFFFATASGDITILLEDNWSPYILLTALRPGTDLSDTLCSADFSGETCVGRPPDCISCSYSSTQITIDVNLLLRSPQNGKTVRMEWSQRPGQTVYSDRNYTLPNIFGVDTGSVTLTIGGLNHLPTEKVCNFTVSAHTGNYFELCCSSGVGPCYAGIHFRGVVVASGGTPCVTFRPTANKTGVMKLLHSLCTMNSYVMSGICIVRKDRASLDGDEATTGKVSAVRTSTGKVTTSATTPLTSPAAGLQEIENISLTVLVLSFLLALAVFIIIAMIALWVTQRMKRKRRKKSRASKMNEAPVKTEPDVVPTSETQRSEKTSDITSIQDSGAQFV